MTNYRSLLKIFMAIIAMQMMQSGLWAQSASVYSFSKSTGTFSALSPMLTPIASGDEVLSTSQNIGFTFSFGGNNYSTFKASSNGFINLGGNLTSALFSNNLNSTTNHPILAPLWDDLTSDVVMELSGMVGNQVLTVEWRNVKWKYNATSAGFTFQAKLYEGTNVIEFIYGDSTAASTATRDASIGINTSPGGATNFLNVNTDLTTATSATSVTSINLWPGLGTVYTFTPPSGDFLPPVIQSVNVNPNTTSCNPVNRTFEVQVTDATGVDSVKITYTVNGGTPQMANLSLSMGTAQNGTWSITLSAANINGFVNYTITARDSLGNLTNPGSSGSFQNGAAFTINAGNDQTINLGDNATLRATTTFLQGVKITEVTLFATGTGQTNPYPGYMTASGDFVEITNLSDAVMDLSGATFEVYGTGARTYTFPNGVILNPGELLVLVLGTGTDQPANKLYYSGGSNDAITSGALSGFVLKRGSYIFDAVAANGYTFLPASGVTSSDWSGNIPSSSGKAGIIRVTSDNNNASDWVVSNTPSPLQTIGSLNPGLSTSSLSAITWMPGNLVGATQVVSPSSTTTYTATLNDGTCSVSDDVTVNVNGTPQPPVADFVASNTTPTTADNVTLTDLSTNNPNAWQWTITPNTFTYITGNTNSQNPVVKFNAAGTYTVELIASNNHGSDTMTKVNYITVTLSYCNSGATSTLDTDIGQFTFDSFVNGSATPVLNNASATGTYSDFTTLDTLQANINGVYAASVSHITSGGTFYNAYIKVWIDFNQNGSFDNDEMVLEGPTTQSAPTVSGNITIPPTALLGVTRLRIVQLEGGSTTSTVPCGTFSYGETEDYSIEILPSLPCTNPPVAGTASVNPMTVHPNEPVYLNLTGYNGSVQWQYSTDGVTFMNIPSTNQVPDTVYASALGTFYVRAWVTNPNCPADSSNIVTINVVPRIGENASNPKLITSNNYTDTDSTFGYINDYTGPNNQAANDIFYQLIVPTCTDSIDINTCATTFDSYIHVLKNGTHVISDDDGCGGVGVGSKIVLNSTQFAAGDTLLIIVEGYSSTQGTYTLSVNTYTSAPNSPMVSDTSLCGSGSVVLMASGTGTILWYDQASGGTSIASGSSFNTPVLNSTTTYYVEAVAGACTSTRVPVTVTVVNVSAPTVMNDTVCVGGTAILSATADSNATILWLDAPNGNVIATGNSFTYGPVMNDTMFYVVAVANGCTSNAVGAMAQVQNPTFPSINVPDTVYLNQPFVVSASGALTYSWNFGPAAIPDTASGPGPHTVIYTVPGFQFITLYYTVECGTGTDSILIPVFVDPNVSRSLQQNFQVSVYPNPNAGQFAITATLPTVQPMTFALYNALGQLVFTKSYTTDRLNDVLQLDLPAGVYSFKLSTSDALQQGKIVIQK